LLHEPDHHRKEVPFVLMPKLLPSYRKGWTRQPTGDNVHTLEWTAIEGRQVLFNNIPVGTVQAKSGASVFVDLDESSMVYSSLFQPKSLTTRPGAKL